MSSRFLLIRKFNWINYMQQSPLVTESSDSGSSAGQYYLQIADQSGKSLDLPDDERKVSDY